MALFNMGSLTFVIKVKKENEKGEIEFNFRQLCVKNAGNKQQFHAHDRSTVTGSLPGICLCFLNLDF